MKNKSFTGFSKLLSIILTGLIICFSVQQGNAQVCTSPPTPIFNFNFVANPVTDTTFGNVQRAGSCCAALAGADANCINLILQVGPATAGVQIDIISGSGAGGAFFASSNCGALQPAAGAPICLNNTSGGVETVNVSFCKPGANLNIYRLTTVARPFFPNDTVALGCSDTMKVLGMTGVTWTSIFPGAVGQYNSLLSSTSVQQPVFTPTSTTPALVRYRVCGTVTLSACLNQNSICDTVDITVTPSWSTAPDVTICQPTSSASLGAAPLSAIWTFLSGPATPTVNGSTGAVTNMTANGTYNFLLRRTRGDGVCTDTASIIRAAKPSAGNDQSICAPQTTASLGAGTGGNTWTSLTPPAVVDPNTGAVSGMNSAGNYSFRLGSGNCSDTVVVNVRPQPAQPTCSNNGPLCVGATLNLTSSSVTPGVTYLWSNSPAGFNSGTQNPTISNIALANAGAYKVVAILNTCPSDTCFTTLVVNPIPAAPTVGSNSPVCEGNTISLTASGPGGSTYSWTGPGGYTSLAQNPNRTNATLAMAGSYCAKDTVLGCVSAQACTTVVVNPKPVISAAIGTNPTTCGGSNGNIQLCGLVAGNFYDIDYSKGGSPQPDRNNVQADVNGCVTITGLNQGSYSNFSITLGLCTSFITPGPIVLSDPSTPNPPTPTSNSPVCEGDNIILGATGQVGATYNWTGPCAFISSQQNPTRTIATTCMDGLHCVTQTVAGCTSNQACVDVTVNVNPVILGVVGSDPTTCGGTNGTLTISGLNNNQAYTVTYRRNGSQLSASNNSNGSGQFIISGLNAASYSHIVVTLNSTSCSSDTFLGPVVLSDPSQPAPPTLGSNSPVCEQGTLNLTALPNGGTYLWNGPNGFSSGSQNPTRTNATLAMDGQYCATHTVAGCVSNPACITVVINPKPVIGSVTSSAITTCGGADGCIFINGLVANTQYTGISYERNNSTVIVGTQSTNGSGQIVICGLNAATYDAFSVTLNTCVSSAFGGSVTLSDPTNPSPPSGVSSNTPVCVGNTIVLNATGAPTATFNWVYPDGPTSNVEDPTRPSATLGMSGSYCVTQTVNNCTSIQACTPVVVSPLPVASAGPDTSVCNGTNIAIGGSPTASGGTQPYSYNWSGGLLAVANPTIVNPTASNIYTVTVSDVRGCSATASALVTVNARPVADAGNDQSLVSCDVTGVNIGGIPTASGGQGPGYTFLWSPPTGIAPGAETSSNPLVSGIGSSQAYTVLVTDENGCTANDNVFVTVIAGSYSAVIIPNTSVSWCEEDAGADITLSVVAVGGTPSYTYTWTGTAFSDDQGPNVTAKPLLPGKYIYAVVVTDQTGCQAGDTIEVTVYPTPVANAGFIPDTVCSGALVTLGGNPTASGGTPGYTYLWSGAAGTVANPVVQVFISTTYQVVVTDTNGCSASSTKLVEVYPLPSADAGTDVDLPSCSPIGIQIGGSPVASGGSGSPFTYLWSPSVGLTSTIASNPFVIGIPFDTTYTVVITDKNGCTDDDQVRVTVINATPSVSISASGPTTWCANSGASINLQANVTGGTGTPDYNWSGSFSGPNNSQVIAVNPQAAGSYTYNVTVTDDAACTANATRTITVTSNPVANAGLPSTICANECDTIGGGPTGSGGTPPYTYNWSNGSTSANPVVCPVLAVTIYTVTVTDSNGCTATAITAVTVRPSPVADAGPDKTIFSCSPRGVAIGGVPTASGGCGEPFTYNWSPAGPTGASPLVLPSITTHYFVTITDACGCTDVDDVWVFVVDNTPTVSISSSNTPEWCAGSGGTTDLTADVLGGTPGYSFDWSGNPNPDNAQTVTASPSVAGTYTYTVTVSDAASCTATASRTVTVNPNPTAHAGVDDSICNGECVTLGAFQTGTGGTPSYTYSWSHGALTSNPVHCPLTSTTYIVTVTDSKNCKATDAVTIIVTPKPVASAGQNKTLITCNGDSVTIGGTPTASGGSGSFTYLWSPSGGLSSNTVANPVVKGILVPTTYCVTVTDANTGCTATACVTIDVDPNSLQAQVAPSQTYCEGSVPLVNLSGTPTASGGTAPYVYSWSGTPISSNNVPNPSAQPSVTTPYCVTVTDANGCSASACMTITVNPKPVANAGNDTAVCNKSPVVIGGVPSGTGTGLLTYTWTPGTGLTASNIANPIATPGSTETYCLTVTDGNGCTASNCMTLSINPNPVADAGEDIRMTSCGGDSALLGGSPASGGGTGALTCSWTSPTCVSNPNICNPYIYGSCLTAGIYLETLTVTDVNGCSASDVVRITVTNGGISVDAGPDVTVCEGNLVATTLGGFDVVLGGDAPYTFAWSSTPGTFTSNAGHPSVLPTVTTTYCLTVTDANGCSGVDCMTIIVNPNPVANAGRDTAVCLNNCVTLGGSSTGSGGTGVLTFEWAPVITAASNPTVCPVGTTTYRVTVTDAAGCSDADEVEVTINQNPVADAGGDKFLVSCPGDSVQIGGSPSAIGGQFPYTYSWSHTNNLFTAVDANPWVKGLNASQTYTLVVTDANGCTAQDAANVSVIPSTLSADAGNGGSICLGSGDSVTLGGGSTFVGGVPAYTFAWSSTPLGISSTVAHPVVSPTVTTTYCVTVTDSKGCNASSCATVIVNPLPAANAGNDTTVCQNQPVQLGGNPTATGGTIAYTYNWGSGPYSCTDCPNPFLTTTTAGTSTLCVTVTDSKGCTASDCISVTVRANPTASAGPPRGPIPACDNSCVQIGGSPTGSGGGGLYTFSWSPATSPIPLSDPTVSNPFVCNLGSDATYCVTVTDQFGCSASSCTFIDVVNPTLTACAGPDESFCAGSGTCVTLGCGPFTGSGGALPYTYTWSSTPVSIIQNIASPVVCPTVTTTYDVVVTDANGCIATDQKIVTVNPRPVITPLRDLTICEGENALLGNNPTATSGSGPLTYAWSPGGGLSCINCPNPIANPLLTTTYCITVTDSLGCSASACQSVTVNPKPVADAGPNQTIFGCLGASATLGGSPTGSGGSNNFTYQWAPCNANLSSCTQPNPIVTGITVTTTYCVTVTDNVTGCTSTDCATITVLPSTLEAHAGRDTTYCSNTPACIRIGGITEFTPTATGGVPPYRYRWSPGVIDTVQFPCVSPVGTTTYCVTVTDANGCSAVDCMTLTFDPIIIVNAGLDSLICPGSCINLGGNPVASGGTPGFTYSWSAGTFPTNVEHPQACPSSNTTYTVTVTDALGCKAIDQVDVRLRMAPIADAGLNVVLIACTGDSTNLGGTPTATGTQGPYTYQWSPTGLVLHSDSSNPRIGNLGFTTTFCVTVTDVYGCTASDCQTTNVVPNTLFVNAGVDRQLCTDQLTCVTLGGVPAVTGGIQPYRYKWFPAPSSLYNPSDTVPNPIVCPVSTTSYTLVVTDDRNCVAADSVIITVTQSPVASITGLNSQYCVNAQNAIITPLPAGGQLSGPGITGNLFSPSLAGVGGPYNICYSVCVGGCCDTVCQQVTVNPIPQVSVTGYRPSYCSSDTCVTLIGTPSGGTFSSNPGLLGSIFCPASAPAGLNTITYTYTDPQTGCTGSTTINITVNPEPTNTVTVTPGDTVCLGQSLIYCSNYSNDVINIQYRPLGSNTILFSGLNCTPPITPVGVDYCVVATAIGTNGGCVTRDTICTHINQPPVAVIDNAQTCEEQSVPIAVLDNDTDPEGDCMVTSILSTGNGSASTISGNIITYVPDTDFNGTDTLIYRNCNCQCPNQCDTGFVIVSVCPINDTPVAPPVSITICKDSVGTVVMNNTDVDTGDILTATDISCSTLNGSITNLSASGFTYNPAVGFVGTQTICIQVCDTSNACDTATITITVNPCNQPPVAADDFVKSDLCDYDTLNIPVLGNDTDPDAGDVLTVSEVFQPAGAGWGSATVSNNIVTYYPGTDTGQVTIRYRVCDNGDPSLCDTGTITINVIDCIMEISEVADTICLGTQSRTCLSKFVQSTQLAWTITNICSPQNGTAVISQDPQCFNYTPTQGFLGNDTFCVTVCDNLGHCDDTSVVMTVLDCEIVATDEPCDSLETPMNTPITIDVIVNDILPFGGDTVVTIECEVTNGTSVLNVDNTITITPTTDFEGDITFCYRVCVITGSFAICDTATVCISVIDTNCYIPNAFSPNGDGVNDEFEIPCNDKYENATLRIYNRWGVEVWFSEGHYIDNFKGRNMQDTPLPDGTYYLIYDYNDGSNKREAKFVVIHR